MPSTRTERDPELDVQILSWRAGGATFAEIGRRLGVSRQRATQLWERAQEPYVPPTCWCGVALPQNLGRGRPPKYCSPEHVRRGFLPGRQGRGIPGQARLHRKCTGCGTEHQVPKAVALCGDCGAAYRARRRSYAEMVEQYGELCGICGMAESSTMSGKIRRLAIDHDHVTGAIRGLLCQKCNTMLGMARDDVAILEAAISYLARPTG